MVDNKDATAETAQRNAEIFWTTKTLSMIFFQGEISVSKLEQDRYYGRGIPYITVGGKVLYRDSDVKRYLDSNTVGGPNK